MTRAGNKLLILLAEKQRSADLRVQVSRDPIAEMESQCTTRARLLAYSRSGTHYPSTDWHEKRNRRLHMSAGGVRSLRRAGNVFIHSSAPSPPVSAESYIFRVSCIRVRCISANDENPYVSGDLAIGHVPIKIQPAASHAAERAVLLQREEPLRVLDDLSSGWKCLLYFDILPRACHEL